MRDLSNIPYDAWVDFIFDHEVSPIETAWHFEDEWAYTCSATTLIANLTKLFRSTAPLVSKYSLEQIDQGFWFIPSSNGFMWAILSPDVPFQDRCECIESITKMFVDLFCRHKQLEVSGYMWWDSVFSYCVLDDKSLSTETEVLERVALTLTQMLQMGCPASKASATHGIEHMIKMYQSVESQRIHEIITSNFDVQKLGLKL